MLVRAVEVAATALAVSRAPALTIVLGADRLLVRLEYRAAIGFIATFLVTMRFDLGALGVTFPLRCVPRDRVSGDLFP